MNEVNYSEVELTLVDEFNRKEAKHSNDWSNTQYENIKESIKNHYKVEQNYTCPYCKVEIPVKHGMVWDIEHIIPRVLKPSFMFEPQNLCVVCKDCNGAKSDEEVLVNPRRVRFPNKSRDYKIVHPHFDKYEDHINPILPGDFYRPLSLKGEFTIIKCRLLRFYGVVDRTQPDKEIDELAKALISSDGMARTVLEDELVRRITEKRNSSD